MPWSLLPIINGLLFFLDLFNLLSFLISPFLLENISSDVFFTEKIVSGKSLLIKFIDFFKNDEEIPLNSSLHINKYSLFLEYFNIIFLYK